MNVSVTETKVDLKQRVERWKTLVKERSPISTQQTTPAKDDNEESVKHPSSDVPLEPVPHQPLKCYETAIKQRTGHCYFVHYLEAFVTLFGKDCAIFLSRLIHCVANEGSNGWTCKTVKQWTEQTGLSRCNIETVKRQLGANGMKVIKVEARYRNGSGHPCLHWSVDHQRLMALIDTLSDANTSHTDMTNDVESSTIPDQKDDVESSTIMTVNGVESSVLYQKDIKDKDKDKERTEKFIDHDEKAEQVYLPEFYGKRQSRSERPRPKPNANLKPEQPNPSKTEDSIQLPKHPNPSKPKYHIQLPPVFLDKQQGCFKIEDPVKFKEGLIGLTNLVEIDSVVNKVMHWFGNILNFNFMDCWLADQYRYWSFHSEFPNDHDFSQELRNSFVKMFTPGKVSRRYIQKLVFIEYLRWQGISFVPWTNKHTNQMLSLIRTVCNAGGSTSEYLGWFNEKTEHDDKLTKCHQLYLSESMVSKYLYENRESFRQRIRYMEDKQQKFYALSLAVDLFEVTRDQELAQMIVRFNTGKASIQKFLGFTKDMYLKCGKACPSYEEQLAKVEKQMGRKEEEHPLPE